MISESLSAEWPITIPSGYTITLATPQSGIKISRGEVFPGTPFDMNMFVVFGTLKLGDPSYPQNSKLTLDGTAPVTATNSLIVVNPSSTLQMCSNVVLENNFFLTGSPAQGGAVHTNGTFNMFGGTIRNNKAIDGGGGVFVDGGGNLKMSGNAEIIDNDITSASFTVGGGVYFEATSTGNLEMSGYAKINDNKANSTGGNVCGAGVGFELGSSGDLIMEGNAEINYNKAKSTSLSGAIFGGGVYFCSSGDFKMDSGNPKINNNSAISDYDQARGGGVFLIGNFIMNTGQINENEAKGDGIAYGGGVHNDTGSFTMNNGEINDNSAESATAQAMGGGVSLLGTFTMNNGKIINNRAESIADQAMGGGVYVRDRFRMYEGDIKGNYTIAPVSSDSNGGGVYVRDGALIQNTGDGMFMKFGGTIDGCDGFSPSNKNRALDSSLTPPTVISNGTYSPGHAVFLESTPWHSNDYGSNSDTAVNLDSHDYPGAWDF